jgi:hypothetical protein
MTADRDFLFWMHERLVHRYGENENTDFVQKLKAIAHVTPPKVDTPAHWNGAKNRYCVLGETSTVGPRWQVWDQVEHVTVMASIPDEHLANVFAGHLNKYEVAMQQLVDPKSQD